MTFAPCAAPEEPASDGALEPDEEPEADVELELDEELQAASDTTATADRHAAAIIRERRLVRAPR
ncbi:MAG TPA: hypothetical protein VHZ03_48795 [Trebonia sp.]|nr:hypothetical protein [Trebonia sp.]